MGPSLESLIDSVSGFNASTHTEKIHLFLWHLHSQRGVEHADLGSIKACYNALSLAPPDVGLYLKSMSERRPPEVLKSSAGYRLEGTVRRRFDAKYGQHPTRIAITSILAELPAKLNSSTAKEFLEETLLCYRVGAFRAATVMAWNLAFDHVLTWLLGDASRVAQFQASIAVRFPKKSGVVVSTRESIADDFKEFEVIEVLKTANLISKPMARIMAEKLARRNHAAHPSGIKINQHQADDTISDLVNNVMLPLS